MITLNSERLCVLDAENFDFPNVECAVDKLGGLLAIGGDLKTKRLLNAYKLGIFPWYSAGEPILWYAPNPRMVITPERAKISRSLKKTLRKKTFDVRVNAHFKKVIEYCVNIKRVGQDDTWITDEMQAAYIKLNAQGYAHSVETYEAGRLVGGLYGVGLGRVFFGESMFSCVSDAAKIAFFYLVKKMDYHLIDCQIPSAHLASLGAYKMTRSVFSAQLRILLR